ncbi:MAG: N-acetylmuramoyl-L-alanine amidase [Firmicutes bacterium]|nr:N-acetylmuramoyl-L-alanine amidase [Bacillota bacterium]
MKKSNRVLSILISTVMITSAFSFAPASFAETADDTAAPAAETTSEEAALGQASQAEDTAAENPVQTPEQDVPETAEVYKISTIVQPQNSGTIKVNPSEVSKGESATYTVVPADGNKLVSLEINGKEQETEDPYGTVTGTFVPEADTVIKAVFDSLGTYKITTSVNSSSKGSITKSANVSENGSFTVKATPKDGYYVADLQVDGESLGSISSYTFDHVTSNHKVKAVFKKQIKIMLDAGHFGNYNRSPVYASYYESKMSWALHNYLKKELESYGFEVGVTRSSQAKDLGVYYRGTASKGYDLFLSLHSNSSTSKTSDYPLIITQKGNTGDAIAKGLGKAIQSTMKTKQAYKIWQKLNKDGKTEYYGVLRGAKAVGTKGMIVEHSFHTNLAATKWLSSNSNLKKMAKAEAAILADDYGMTKDSVPSGGDDNSSANPSEPTEPTTKPSEPTTSEPTTPAPVKTVSTSQKVKVLVADLNMRKSYSSSSKSMGKATKDKTYQLKAKTEDGKWGQIKSNGYWIYLPGYTKVVKDQESDSKTVASSQKVKVTVSNLNMRKSYSSSSKSMGKAKKNKTYQLKAKTKDGKWGQIKSNGYWIYLPGYTKVVSGTKSSSSSSTSKTVASSQKVKITVSSLNMRKSYSTSAKSMGKAKKNKVYQLKAKTKDGKWGQIKSNGYWIYLPGYTKLV